VRTAPHRLAISASLALLALILLPARRLAAAGEPASARSVKSPPTDRPNSHYVSNREPLAPSPLVKLPIGAIEPHGWLRAQLERMADGLTGRLPELSPWCKAEGSAWMSREGAGHSPWEELPYWLKGFGDLGYVLGDERIVAEARRWIEAVLASQEPDGYFGPRDNKKNRDIWPNMVMVNVLQSFHEATGDPRVLPFLSRYFRWQLALPREELLPGSWQKVRAGDNLESIHWLYNRTGEPFLLELGQAVHERTIDWAGGIANWHGVNITQGFREPAVYFVQARDPAFLAAAERNYQTVRDLYGQVPGGMFGADENCRPGHDDPRQAAETCSMVEFMHSFQMLARITGDPLWADRCEEVAFNSLPAAMTPDLKALHYLTAPNMVQLDRFNKAPGLQNGGCMLAYDPRDYRCCQHNVSHGWPYFAEELWLATPDDGLCASLYAPCTVTARAGDGATIQIREETDYPFDERVRLTLATPAPVRFPLYLRVPRACHPVALQLNGRPLAAAAEPGAYLVVERTWRDGDELALEFTMLPGITVWEKNHGAVSVHRGPLTFSLLIGERWERCGGTDDWPALEVYPTTPWNYGLDLPWPDPTRQIEVVRRPGPLPAQPFAPEGAPIQLRVRARRIPEWKQDETGLVGALQDSPAYSAEPAETVTLIPMGCARLRVSAFPTVSSGPEAHRWVGPPATTPARASHCNPGDTLAALSDGREPAASGDQALPRMTWWDHRGTREWVEYHFDEPRSIASSEVYWFDDTGAGQCRVPASWRLLWQDGEAWREVAARGPYGTALDRYNRVEFAPVTTGQLRLEVQLQPEFSGGILEWRTGGNE